MSSVLVTGGCGFVGVPVVGEIVARGYDVTVLDDLSRGSERALTSRVEARLEVGDIRDADLVRRLLERRHYIGVVHLAAMHFIPDCDRDPRTCLSVNTTGTQNLITAALETQSVRAFIFASTAAVYAPSEKAHNEMASLAPTDVYGCSKLAAEQLLDLAVRTATRPLALGVARLFNVYGPCETNPHLIPVIATQAYEGKSLQLGNLGTRRDYVFTEDVARGLGALLVAALAGDGGTYNLGTGVARTGHEVVTGICNTIGRDLNVDIDPARVRQSDRPSLAADVTAAQRDLLWSPNMAFETGLAEVIANPRQ